MAETDIELSVGLDTTDVASRSKSLQNEIKRVFDSVDTSKVDDKTKKTLARLSELSGKATDVQKSMQSMEDTLASSLEEQADAVYGKIAELKEKLSKTTSEPLKNAYTAELEKQQTLVDGLEDKIQALNSGDTTAAQMLSQENEEYQKMEQKLLGVNNQMAVLLSTTKKTGSGTNGILKMFTGISNAAKQAGNAIKQHFKSGGNSVKQMGLTAKKVFGVLLGFTTIRTLFMKIKGAIIEGVKNLSQWNNGNNKTNKALSTLMSSLSQLKNALGAAFAPIIQAIAPALNELINLCISAANAVGMLIAKLTGSNTFVKATKIQKNFAKSLKGSGGAANKALASFDQLNNLSSQSGGGGDNPNNMFEEVNVNDLKGDLADFFKVFQDSWNKYGKGVINAWTTALDKIKKLGKDIKDSFMDVWTNGSGEELLGHWLRIITDIGTTVGNLAGQFDEAWTKNEIGTQIFQDIFDILNLISAAIEECTSATAEWSSTLDFYPLLESVDTLLKGIKAVLDPILQIGTTIYTEVILPIAKWIIESGLPAILTLIGKGLETIGKILTEVVLPILDTIFNEFIKPVAQQLGQTIINIINDITKLLDDMGPTIDDLGNIVKTFILPILKTLCSMLSHSVVDAIKTVEDVFGTVVEGIKGMVDSMMEILHGIVDFITGVFTGDWEKAWEGVKEVFKGIWNGIATLLETVVNSMIDLLNGFNIDVPDEVPLIGGTKFGFDIKHVSVPKLAQGAVIPPNKEFLAVLGDQNNGTNVEAPLDTIKQAVAEVISDEMISLLTQQVNLLQQIEDKDIVVSENNLFKTVRNKARTYEKSTGQNAFSF